MTDIETVTMDYWWAAKAVRTGRVITGRPMGRTDVMLAHQSLIEVYREGPTQRLRDCARQVCLARGIVAVGFTLHDGSAA